MSFSVKTVEIISVSLLRALIKMKICEYDDVKCPFCQQDNLKVYDKTILNQHIIYCDDCTNIFFITCV